MQAFLVNNTANWQLGSVAAHRACAAGRLGEIKHVSAVFAAPLEWLFGDPDSWWAQPLALTLTPTLTLTLTLTPTLALTLTLNLDPDPDPNPGPTPNQVGQADGLHGRQRLRLGSTLAHLRLALQGDPACNRMQRSLQPAVIQPASPCDPGLQPDLPQSAPWCDPACNRMLHHVGR